MMRNRKGFTLVELIIVIIIIGVLAAVAAPMMQGNVSRAQRTEAVAALGALRTAARLWQVEHPGSIPTKTDILTSGTITAADLSGKYYPTEANYTMVGAIITATSPSGVVTMNINNGEIIGG